MNVINGAFNTKILLVALALAGSTSFLLAQGNNQPPEGPPHHDGGTNAPGMHRPPGGFPILPPRAIEQLKLTADQQKQVAELEAETKAKLEKILTPEQMDKLKEMRPPQRPGGPGGQGHQARPHGDGGPQQPEPAK